MKIPKLTALEEGNLSNSNGGNIAFSVNSLIDTNDHFSYEPAENQLKADVSIVTEGSVGFNDSFVIDSGSDSIAIINKDEATSVYPVVGGFKDQSIVANQDETGLIKETVPRYDANLSEFEPVGAVNPTGAVIYQSATTSTISAVLCGLEVVIAETITPSDILYYRQYRGSDATGSRIVNQQLINLSLADGDLLEWWLTPPIKGSDGDVRYVELLIAPNGDLNNIRPVLVRPPISDPSRHWVKVKIRAYENEIVGIKNREFELISETTTLISNNQASPTYVTGFVLDALSSSDFELITYDIGGANERQWIKNVGNKTLNMSGDSLWQVSQGAGGTTELVLWSERSADDGATFTENPKSLRKREINNNNDDSVSFPSSVRAWLPGESISWAMHSEGGGSISLSAPSATVNGSNTITGVAVGWQLIEIQA